MHTKFKRALYLGLAIVMLAGAAGLMGPVQTQREEYQLGSTPVEGVSPELAAATQALGAFRGIMLDLVWIRLQHLKNEGRFFEMVQLSEWACKLAPHFSKIWQFHSWNLAYNVSVEINYLPDRWSWVNSGVEVLRDEAIPVNPRDPELYNALAQLYLIKIAGRKDDAHTFYKAQLGAQMHLVLGGEGSPEKLQSFMQAPDGRKKLLQEPGVEQLRKQCREHGFDPVSVSDYFTYLSNPDSLKEEVRELLESSNHEEAVKTIETYVRARRLEDTYRLKPAKMLEVMRNYAGEGREYLPFDWRSPYPHAIYWGTQAVEIAQDVKESIMERRREFGVRPQDLTGRMEDMPEWQYREIDYDRTIYQAFQGLVRHGRLVYNEKGQLLPVLGPNYQFTDAMLGMYDRMLEKYGEGMFGDSIRSSEANFLQRISVEMYLMGSREKAVRYWEMLVEKYAEDDYRGDFSSFIDRALEVYVENMNQTDARRMVRGLLTRSFLFWGSNQGERAAELQQKARNLTQQWNKTAETQRWRIPYQDIRDQVLMDIFSGRIQMSDSLLENLKAHLGEDTVQKYQEAAEQRPERVAPPELQRRYRYAPGGDN